MIKFGKHFVNGRAGKDITPINIAKIVEDI
jgi:hypothetical protein